MTIKIEWTIENSVAILQSPENPTFSDRTIEDLASKGFNVIITIADYDFSICWKVGSGVKLRHYQCALGNYPEPSDWELQHLNEFLLYEIDHNRRVVLWCENAQTMNSVKDSIQQFFRFEDIGLSEFVSSKLASQPERARNIPSALKHCHECREEMCNTDLVCHVTSVIDAERILKSGIILSATRARSKSGRDLAGERRNAAGDPPDYFEYVMFTFGNCTAGDRLVMERILERFPTQRELTEEFQAGVRFYFRYIDLVGNPGFRSDGYHYCKIKDMLELEPYLIAAIAPESARTLLSVATTPRLKERLSFLDDTSYSDLWSWSHRAYEVVKKLV